jgi:hypothetical protein
MVSHSIYTRTTHSSKRSLLLSILRPTFSLPSCTSLAETYGCARLILVFIWSLSVMLITSSPIATLPCGFLPMSYITATSNLVCLACQSGPCQSAEGYDDTGHVLNRWALSAMAEGPKQKLSAITSHYRRAVGLSHTNWSGLVF